MSDIFMCETEKLEKQGVKVIKIEKEYRKNGEKHTTIEVTSELDFSAHDKVFEDKIAKLEKKNKDLERCFIQREQDSTDTIMKLKQEKSDKNEKIAELACENESLKQRIAELESKEAETCEKEPISDDCRPSMEWYDNRHQSDCIEINRLNTTIDVLIHKVEYLRQFSELE